jgi:hypothetical protein
MENFLDYAKAVRLLVMLLVAFNNKFVCMLSVLSKMCIK